MVAVPNTRTRLSHALTIRVRGRIIGAIHSWAPSTSRTVDTEFEVETNSNGMPVDQVPQTVDRREIRIARYDTYPAIMEEVFGTSELITLTDQFQPFTLREVWRGPGINPLGSAFGAAGSALAGLSSLAGPLGLSPVQNAAAAANAELSNALGAAGSSIVGSAVVTVLGTLTADTRMYEYLGCYFTDIGRSMDAKGDRVVSVDATITWLSRRRVA